MKTILHNCPKCNKEFNAWTKWGLKKFCSRACSNSRERPKDVCEKISETLKSSPTLKLKYSAMKLDKTCPVCNKLFKVNPSEDKIYCSRDCYLADKSHRFRKQTKGGYRAGSGRAKTGNYKGIYCGSTYELCWVIYNIDHNVSFTRFDSYLEKDGLKYYPDFLLADGKTIIEIKGYENQESVDKKTALAERFGYTVIVLRKEQLEKEFRYVSERYSSNYKTLYDGYKPKYNYVCSHCATEFSRDFKLKTDVVFCSRRCAGKGHKGRVK